MIGIILIAHAHIATETKAAVEHILGKQDAFGVVDIANSDMSDEEKQHYEGLLTSVDMGQGILVMVDLFGATPCNIALQTGLDRQIKLIAGFNVPTVIKAVTLRDKKVGLEELASLSVDAGKRYIRLISDKENES